MLHAVAPELEHDEQADPLDELRSRQELASLLQGADAGLALYDDQFNLVVCNAQYRARMGFRDEEAVPGASLADLMMLSSGREASGGLGVKRTIETVLERLSRGQSHTVAHTTPDGHEAEIHRRVIASGMVVETVTERLAAPDVDPAAAFAGVAEAARSMMVQALDVMSDGFALFDKHGRLVVYNRRYVELNAIVSDLIRPGLHFEHLIREIARRGGFAIGDEAITSYVETRLNQHRSGIARAEFQRSDGRWFQVSDRRTDDGSVVTLLSDISHMKQREFELVTLSTQLQARNTHFNAALNNMAQGLCLFDADMKLLVANQRYMDIYRFTTDDVKPGMSRSEIIRHSGKIGNLTEDAERIIERFGATNAGVPMTVKQHLSDGRVIAVMSEPMVGGGAVTTYTDITDAELHALKLREHAVKLERSNRDLEEFAYVASHDLQEPLRKIEAFGDRLSKRYGGTLPEDGQMFIERMQNAAGRMRRLINDLLGYSRVMTKANPQKAVDLNAVLADVLSDLQVRIDESGVTVVARDLPMIEADPVQMGQMFQNLLSNAMKFVRPGVKPEISISARLEGDEHPLGRGAARVVITIADNGIGFDNKYKQQIFKIFQRLHGRLEYEGTGVGLATVRKIVERHQGTIDCDGRPGEGATFIVTLPVVAVEEAHGSMAAAGVATAGHSAG
jgi:signal transduction histidine kinase